MAVVEIKEEYAYSESVRQPSFIEKASNRIFRFDDSFLEVTPPKARILTRLLEDLNNGHHGVLEEELNDLARRPGAKSNPAKDLFFDLRADGIEMERITLIDDDLNQRSYRLRLLTQEETNPIETSPDIEPPRLVVEQVELSDEERVAKFEAIFDEHQHHIFNYLYRMFSNPEDALDLTQETFLRAYEGLPKYKDEGKVKPWLFKIATNAGLDEKRRRQVIKWQQWDSFMSVFHPQQVARNNTEGDVIAKENAEIVQQVLDRLPPRYRLCLKLREYEELSCEEISEILGTTRGAVKALLFKARDKFREIYKAIDAPTPPPRISSAQRAKMSVASRRRYVIE